MRISLICVLLCSAAPVIAQDVVPSTLVGHAMMPAFSFSALPSDAPQEAMVSGKFMTADKRVDAPFTVVQPTGERLPFLGQPIQGFSGYAITLPQAGGLWALIDNGYGTRANSTDALLSFTRITPDFETGATTLNQRIWLRDPNKVVPFRIVHEGTTERYLTGGDFDLESIQVIGDTVWIAEEFGPYLISATLSGEVTGVYPTMFNGAEVRSRDHALMRAGSVAGVDYTVQGSGGYEGMALAEDGTLWLMLEKPLLDETGMAEGDFLRVFQFDPAARAWTGDSVKFALTPGAEAIGDFNFVDANRALVIERDGGQGDPSLACAEGATEGCFAKPAKVKVVTLIDMAQRDAEGFVARLRQIDLMNITDTDGVARLTTDSAADMTGKFTFPFVTIESVKRDGDEHILVSNDNNFPFSAGRRLAQADANEVIRLHVPELLAD